MRWGTETRIRYRRELAGDVVSGTTTPSATHRAVGVATHAALGELAELRDELKGPGRTRLVLRVAARHARAAAASTGCRVGAQHVAPLCSVAVAMFPPHDWLFCGAEVRAGAGVADLVWRSAQGEMLIDEVKVTGLARVLEDSRTRAQIDRYRAWGRSEFGDLFVGVRLLALAGPMRSRWYPPTGPSRRLVDTEWWSFEW